MRTRNYFSFTNNHSSDRNFIQFKSFARFFQSFLHEIRVVFFHLNTNLQMYRHCKERSNEAIPQKTITIFGTMEKITWHCKHFKDLTNEELYRIFHLRLSVFVVEQNCPYQDADGKDLRSFHLWG